MKRLALFTAAIAAAMQVAAPVAAKPPPNWDGLVQVKGEAARSRLSPARSGFQGLHQGHSGADRVGLRKELAARLQFGDAVAVGAAFPISDIQGALTEGRRRGKRYLRGGMDEGRLSRSSAIPGRTCCG